MKEQIATRRSVDILARLLAEENITIVHDAYAKTASFAPEPRILTFPVFGDKISVDTQIALALHETGHATETPVSLFELSKKYGHALINILEDVRIEKIVKSKYPGSIKFFTNGYGELVTEYNFFGTGKNVNPFDFNHLNFLDRVNIHFKLGARALVSFNDAEQALVDEIDAMVTFEDMEKVAKKLKALAKENSEAAKKKPLAPVPAEDESDESEEDSDEVEEESDCDGEGSPDGITEEDDSDEESEDDSEDSDSSLGDDLDEESENNESNEGSSNTDEESEDDDSDESDSSSGDDSEESEENESNEGSSNTDEESEDEGELSETSDDHDSFEESDSDEDDDSLEGESDNGRGSDFSEPEEEEKVDLDEGDLEESETQKASEESLKELASGSNNVDYLPATKDIPNIAQSWKLIAEQVREELGFLAAKNQEKYKNFRNEIKPIVNTMVTEFNRSAAGTVARRTSYKDIGVLDTNKMVHYRYNENIFKRRKFVRDGKNHGIIAFIDNSGSMGGGRIYSIARQILIMTEFCQKVNIPFRVYGWGEKYLMDKNLPPIMFKDGKRLSYDRGYDGCAMVELLSSDMPKAILEMFSSFLLNCGSRFCDNGTPLGNSLYYALPIVSEFRKSAGVDIMNMMFFSDGESSRNLRIFNANTIIDNETGKMYSKDMLDKEFYSNDYTDGSRYGISRSSRNNMFRTERTIYWMSKVLKDRYNVSLTYMFMNTRYVKNAWGRSHNTSSSLYYRMNSGQWSDTEMKNAKSALSNGERIAKLGDRGTFTSIVIEDGYDVSLSPINGVRLNKHGTKKDLEKSFISGTKQRKASTVFATIVAQAIAS